jgi:hypothetical protein
MTENSAKKYITFTSEIAAPKRILADKQLRWTWAALKTGRKIYGWRASRNSAPEPITPSAKIFFFSRHNNLRLRQPSERIYPLRAPCYRNARQERPFVLSCLFFFGKV